LACCWIFVERFSSIVRPLRRKELFICPMGKD
jgi:hypothetical protein